LSCRGVGMVAGTSRLLRLGSDILEKRPVWVGGGLVVRLMDGCGHASPAPGVVSVVGRGRSAAEVAVELMDVLADEPRVVECDLAGVAADGPDIAGAFQPVDRYLARWPGPVVMVHAPQRSLHAGLQASASTDRLLIHGSWEVAGEHHVLPMFQRHRLGLRPGSAAPRIARSFVTSRLLDWQMSHLVGSAGQVVSELVNAAITEPGARVELSVSRVDERVRIAVRDDGPCPNPRHDRPPASGLSDTGRHLVMAFADSWDVIPAPSGGKTVWTVLDGSLPHDRARVSHERTVARAGRRPVPSGKHRQAWRRRHGRGLGAVVPRWHRSSRPDAPSI
jgi:hypothetical protein